MVALLRSTDGEPDSRFEKYTEFLTGKNIPFFTICWDRKNVKTESLNKVFYKRPSAYAQYYGNIKGLIGFNKFLFKTLKKRREEYKVIHACDFDTILPAILMHILYRKKVIYDIFDWYIDSRSLKGFIKWIVYCLEFINLKLSSAVIICEKERRVQLNTEPKRTWILPNIPNYGADMILDKKNDKLTISYVGVLTIDRGLENLIRYAKENQTINLKIAGFGPLEKELQDISNHPNITFFGSVKYTEALQLMNSSDIVYAMYQKTNRNHILAAPNKYYEGLYLGKPIITTKGTIVGDKTEKNMTGFVIEESYQDLVNLIESIDEEAISEYSKNARTLWHNKYATYVQDFLDSTYLDFINKNNK